MKMNFTARQMKVFDIVKEIAEKKLAKFDRFFPDDAEMDITFSKGNNLERVEITIRSEGMIKIVRKYSNIEELTTELLHEFIDKIIVHHKEKVFGETIQRVEIYYKMIGQVQIPKLSRSEIDSYKKSFGRTKKEQIAC